MAKKSQKCVNCDCCSNSLNPGEFLASLWTQLDRYPTILARRNSPDNVTFELTQKVQNHLEKQQQQGSPSSFSGMMEQSKSLLIILDRGMDLSTVWLHDLAFQVFFGC